MNHPNKHIIKMSLFFASISLLLLVSLTALWLNKTIFNTENFTRIATTTFNEESSRESIGDLIAARIFENSPILKVTLSDRLSGSIAGILGSETAQTNIEKLARESHLIITSPERKPFELDLVPLKSFISSAQELVQNEDTQRRINTDDIPDKIMILDTSTLPNIHKISVYLFLAGPLALMVAFGLAGYWLKKGGKQNLYKRFRIILLVMIATAILALIIGPLAEPSFISIGRDAPSQSLLRNIYEGFTQPYRNQALWFGFFATFILLLTTAWYEFNRRYKIIVKVSKK